jgi:hypothetical protein
MVTVYYPYYQQGSIWNELIYSLRSIDMHFTFDYQVVIVGDLPKGICNVRHIPLERITGVTENTTYDAIHKLISFLQNMDRDFDFIRMYDDVYILRDVSLEDFTPPRSMPYHVPRTRGVWFTQLERTVNYCKSHGLHGLNTETHIPELFNSAKMFSALMDHPVLSNRFLTSTLYHSLYFPASEIVPLSGQDAVQFYDSVNGIIKVSNLGNIPSKCRGRKFLNHNNSGLNDNLKRFLISTFPEKSRFES